MSLWLEIARDLCNAFTLPPGFSAHADSSMDYQSQLAFADVRHKQENLPVVAVDLYSEFTTVENWFANYGVFKFYYTDPEYKQKITDLVNQYVNEYMTKYGTKSDPNQPQHGTFPG